MRQRRAVRLNPMHIRTDQDARNGLSIPLRETGARKGANIKIPQRVHGNPGALFGC
jgi:hypothetical protein